MAENDSQDNGALKMGDTLAQLFQPAGSPEAEILSTAGRFSFQLRLDQQLVLNRLAMALHHPNMNTQGKIAITEFIQTYTETKRHNDSKQYITDIITATSLKRFMDTQAIKGQIIKTNP